MTKSVRLDSEFVSQAEVYASADSRSVPKQIEHWAQIGKAVEESPNLPYRVVREAFVATAEPRLHCLVSRRVQKKWHSQYKANVEFVRFVQKNWQVLEVLSRGKFD
jgi:hypothetical protein